MSGELDSLLEELRFLTSTAQRLLADVVERQKEAKAFQTVLLKKGLITPEDLATAWEDVARQMKQARSRRSGRHQRRMPALREG